MASLQILTITMKRTLAAIASVLMMSAPAHAETTTQQKIDNITSTICQQARADNLAPTLIYLIGEGGDEKYYRVFRSITYHALTNVCPDQFPKLHATIDGFTADTVPVTYYRLYHMITGLESHY
jgi:hypothetical protein